MTAPAPYAIASQAEHAHLDPIWAKNNRVRQLDLQLIDATGKVVRDMGTIPLDDKWSDDGRRRFLLRPGRYRLVITSVYKGSEWDDTWLGEIRFQTLGDTLMSWLRADPFFAVVRDALLMPKRGS